MIAKTQHKINSYINIHNSKTALADVRPISILMASAGYHSKVDPSSFAIKDRKAIVLTE